MNSAIMTITSGAIRTFLAATLGFMPRLEALQPAKAQSRARPRDRNVLRDIGVEPGSITWL